MSAARFSSRLTARHSVCRYSTTTSVTRPAQSISHHPKHIARSRIVQIDTERGVSPALIDSFHREHNYLRISLTEKCNLRCFYCMPAEGIELSPRAHILTDDEVIRLARLFVQNGVTKIRLTGGEPTIRKGLLDIVRRLNDLRCYGLRSIGMTSNGLVLHRNLSQFVESGLNHLNLSLDTLDPFKFEIMTRRKGHEAVLKTLDAALTSKLESVKLNVVVVKDLNDFEVSEFVEITKDKDISVRFIEFMPFTGNQWDKAKMVPSSQLLSRLQQIHPSITKIQDEMNDTARSYRVPGYKGSFGFISSMSDHFCSTCNRMRLTADGQIKVCLFDAKEISLRDQMRQGATDEELMRTIGLAVGGKKEKHAGMEDIDVTTNRPMILIGVRHSCNDDDQNSSRIRMYGSRRYRSLNICSGKRSDPAIRHDAVVHRRFMSSSSATANSQFLPQLSHFDHRTGHAKMVDVGSKPDTARTAQASGRIYVPEVAYKLITSPDPLLDPSVAHDVAGSIKAKKERTKKGDVLAVAQLAGIMACKRTSELIPLCHPLPLSHIEVALTPEAHAPPSGAPGGARRYSVTCRATASCHGKTGVEMEALTAVSVALLTVWDMLKAVAGTEMVIGEITVDRKSGGTSGDFQRITPGDDTI